jgi:hypothetical protein
MENRPVTNDVFNPANEVKMESISLPSSPSFVTKMLWQEDEMEQVQFEDMVKKEDALEYEPLQSPTMQEIEYIIKMKPEMAKAAGITKKAHAMLNMIWTEMERLKSENDALLERQDTFKRNNNILTTTIQPIQQQQENRAPFVKVGSLRPHQDPVPSGQRCTFIKQQGLPPIVPQQHYQQQVVLHLQQHQERVSLQHQVVLPQLQHQQAQQSGPGMPPPITSPKR